MKANLYALGTTILVTGALYAASDATHRRALSRPQVQVAVAEGMGTVHFDSATGQYRVSVLTPGGRSNFAYEPRTNVELTVEAVVAHDADTDTYSYEYTLQNARTSRQRVGDFSIAYDGDLTDVSVPEGWWRVPSFGRKVVAWACKDCAHVGIAPGAKTSGYRIRSSARGTTGPSPTSEEKSAGTSRGAHFLPGVVRCTAAGDAPVPSIPKLEWLEEGVLRLPTPDEDVVSGRTVGPVNVPNSLTASERIQRIQEYVRISAEEKWIADDEVAASYAAALRRVEAGLSEPSGGDLKRGISKLAKLADNDLADGKITSEAHALVKHNVQHLLLDK